MAHGHGGAGLASGGVSHEPWAMSDEPSSMHQASGMQLLDFEACKPLIICLSCHNDIPTPSSLLCYYQPKSPRHPLAPLWTIHKPFRRVDMVTRIPWDSFSNIHLECLLIGLTGYMIIPNTLRQCLQSQCNKYRNTNHLQSVENGDDFKSHS